MLGIRCTRFIFSINSNELATNMCIGGGGGGFGVWSLSIANRRTPRSLHTVGCTTSCTVQCTSTAFGLHHEAAKPSVRRFFLLGRILFGTPL